MEAKCIKLETTSQLVISQINGETWTKKDNFLQKYVKLAVGKLVEFKAIK